MDAVAFSGGESKQYRLCENHIVLLRLLSLACCAYYRFTELVYAIKTVVGSVSTLCYPQNSIHVYLIF